MKTRPFTPAADTAATIRHLLDIYERRGGHPRNVVRVKLGDIAPHLPGYYSQTDPLPRTVANEQLVNLAQHQWVILHWEPGQANHLLAAVDMVPEHAAALYTLVDREPLAAQRDKLRNRILGHRFRVQDWRRLALDATLDQLQTDKSPTPFLLGDAGFNQDLLDALLSLPEDPTIELPYRIFSVRVFNDSKRFNALSRAVARLARRHHIEWRDLSDRDILTELGLVPNPSHIYLAGPWKLTDNRRTTTSLAPFAPSVGIPSALAANLTHVTVDAHRVICIENLTSFYEWIEHGAPDTAALCLWGNPSPPCRHLLRCLAETLPPHVPLQLWADLDYGGLNILAQLRRTVSPRFQPYHMDVATLNTFAYWGRPVTQQDHRNLTHLRDAPYLSDMTDVIDALLTGEIKLEQEAIILKSP